jgi:transposase
MTRPLSMDIRERLVSAVDGGMSRRSAAERFGVAASTAVKLVDQWHRDGDVAPRRQGGDHRSQRLEAHAEEILNLVEAQSDVTLAEIVEHLARVHDVKASQSSVWRLLDRHAMTFKKNRARQRAATG